MSKITIRNTSGRPITFPEETLVVGATPWESRVASVIDYKRRETSPADAEWEFSISMGKITKRLVVECPNPKCKSKKMAIPHVDNYQDLVGCVFGCSGCGNHIICLPPGKLEVFDDTLHKATKDLPKGDA